MKRLSQLLFAALCGILLFSACKKDQVAPKSALSTSNTTDSNALVATPAGLIPRSHIHLIENGYTLMMQGGHMYKVEKATRNIIEDFGAVHKATSTPTTIRTISGTTGNSGLPTNSVDQDNSWVTDAYATNITSTLIGSFSANWVVPNLPASNDNQLLYIFNGLANAHAATDIMQPVLQWGNGPAGNTNGSWAVANWYVWSNEELGVTAAVTSLVDVSPGTVLEGILTYTGQEGASAGAYQGSYNYTSSFTNVSTGQPINNALSIMGDEVVNDGFVIPYVYEQNTAFVTLETWTTSASSGYNPGVTRASDYPAGQNYVDMYNMVVNVGGSPQSEGWTAENLNTPFGENAQTTPGYNNSTNGGSVVYLYWHPVPTIDGLSNINLTTTNTSYTVSGYPGNPVNIMIEGGDIKIRGGGGEVGTTTSTMTITTPGMTFSNGSATVTASNGIQYVSTTMPASGSFTVNAYYTTTGSGGTLIAQTHAY